MSESLAYAGSPFAEYLQDAGVADDVLEYKGDELAEDTANETQVQPDNDESTPAAGAHATDRSDDDAGERLKYLLATSSLLTPKLADAISSYPASLNTGRVESSLDPVNTIRPQLVSAAASSKRVSWPEDWCKRGQGWRDRNAWANARCLVQGLFQLVRAPAPSPHDQLVALEKIPAALPRSPSPPQPTVQTERASTDTDTLVATERFIAASQELDRRVAQAMTGIREVECVSWGLGLSDPLPPISRFEVQALASTSSALSTPPSSARPRNRSPLSFSASKAPSSHQLRAVALRQVLATTLKDTTTALTEAYRDLHALAGTPSPLSPSTAELARHEAEAEQDRIDAMRRDAELQELLARERRMDIARKRLSWGASSEPSGSSAAMGRSQSDGMFVGIQRQRSLVERGSPAPVRSHRVRPSVGALGAFGVGTAADDAVAAVTPTRSRRRRPASLGVWPGQSLAYALREQRDEPVEGDAPPSTPIRVAHPTPSESTLSLVNLRDDFETMHDVRRSLVWQITTLADREIFHMEQDRISANLSNLSDKFETLAAAISGATQDQFGDAGLGSGNLSFGRTSAAVSHRAADLDFGSTIYDPPHAQSPSLAPSPLLRPSTPGATAGSRHALRRPHASFRGATSFAPPAPSSAQHATTALEQHNAAISIALRTVAAKLHVISSDTRQHAAHSEVESPRSNVDVGRLLAIHDSIRSDLESALRAWEDSRVVLRAAVQPVSTSSSADELDGTDGEEAGSTSLDSIPDDEREQDDVDEDLSRAFSGRRDGQLLFSSSADLEEDGTGQPDDASTFTEFAAGHLEQVYEAVAGSTASVAGHAKLSREERIALKKQERERPPDPQRDGIRVEAGMVAELKGVLGQLKSNRQQLSERSNL